MSTATAPIAQSDNPGRSDLFDPVRVGDHLLADRIVTAPLTRSRAKADGTARPLMAEYYAQRESTIREAAYGLAERRGFSPGHELDDWLAAEHAFDDSFGRAGAADLGTAITGAATDDACNVRRADRENFPSPRLRQTQAQEQRPRWFSVPRQHWLYHHLG